MADKKHHQSEESKTEWRETSPMTRVDVVDNEFERYK
jgi:hypothetical protein